MLSSQGLALATLALGVTGCMAGPDGAGHGSATEGSVSSAAIAPGATTRPITLRTGLAGKFMVAENGGGGTVNADRDAASTWETFTLFDLNGGSLQSGDQVSLQTFDGHFLCAENGGGGAFNATRTDPQGWETFRVVKIGGSGAQVSDGDQIALQTVVSGLYVSALNGGGSGVVANGPRIDTWETFIVGSGVGGGAGGGGGGGTPSPWHLTWQDEFDGSGAVDGGKWGFDIGAGGWGNNELEYYTNRTDNVRRNGQGQLEIVARAESFNGAPYTSGRINTSGKFTQRYGRFEARIKLPSGSGIWPAFWTLGDNIGSAGWPTCGELDIMEVVRNFSVNHGSAHGPGYSGGNPLTATYQLPSGSFTDDYHLFAIEWEPNEVRWYVDNTMYERRTPADLPAGTRWVYDHPFFILLNVAVGGNFPGNPDGTARFPQTMLVDYVRVYAK